MEHIFAAFLALTLSIPAFALSEGEFLPMADSGSPFSRVHFVPKNGNHIIINGVPEKIPPGVGVISGGIIGDVTNACVDKLCGRRLAPLTLYYVYVFMSKGVMKMDFSTARHKEDETYGNEVHENDPTRSLVGMIRTDESGRIHGDANSQMTISWFNRGHTGLAAWIGPEVGHPTVKTCSQTMQEIPGVYLEFLTFGINSSFRQAFTVPNVYVSGTVQSDEIGSVVNVQVGINGKPFSHVASHYQAVRKSLSSINTVAIGAMGAEEGYVRASLFMSNVGRGGCATMKSGTLFVSPLHS